ncbi:MAG: L-serine ammonia-lyase, iron-sulfur-dependent, subunit alpha [Bacteroidia bacterium]|nr:L-serine ammonia-lyase, iron-sulfur-dependent, subunit alpha [Bacteroidia bacterium]MCX7764235.1 L-serine ammonia-lyase, iron-sulfur-dependent, subunit alpha [Bacteroidia bacterium]MDW8056912.1 L-serine ammonia-lyase, iron-sulfur-dependent, subunit alpha [Bacteroidia bacterium]
MRLESFASWRGAAEAHQIPLWRVVLEYEVHQKGRSEAEIWARLEQVYAVMRDAVESGLKQPRQTPSGLVRDTGKKLYRSPLHVVSPEFSLLIAYATAAKETNACMGRVVAAPTAGASGILPGIYTFLEKHHGVSLQTIYEAMLIGAGVGLIIEQKASIAGAVGGCQAETGTAAAMGAAGIVYALGGDTNQIFEAVALTIMNMLGLICDPVAGLVELPCVKRNASAVVIAAAAAQMALAGDTAIIPVDEMVIAMGEVGAAMDTRFKETALGGTAATPTAQAIAQRIYPELGTIRHEEPPL